MSTFANGIKIKVTKLKQRLGIWNKSFEYISTHWFLARLKNLQCQRHITSFKARQYNQKRRKFYKWLCSIAGLYLLYFLLYSVISHFLIQYLFLLNFVLVFTSCAWHLHETICDEILMSFTPFYRTYDLSHLAAVSAQHVWASLSLCRWHWTVLAITQNVQHSIRYYRTITQSIIMHSILVEKSSHSAKLTSDKGEDHLLDISYNNAECSVYQWNKGHTSAYFIPSHWLCTYQHLRCILWFHTSGYLTWPKAELLVS
jgi:hypothetical protein